MTKFFTKAALAATVATGLFAAPAFAATTPDATADFTAKATITKPLTLTNSTALDFGSIIMNPSLTASETVTVSKAGGVAVCGSTKLTCDGTGGAAQFALTGVAGQTIVITYDAPPSVLTHTNGTNTVGFTFDATPNVTLDNTGAGTFAIGGVLTVLAGTVDGDYSATVKVDANYL